MKKIGLLFSALLTAMLFTACNDGVNKTLIKADGGWYVEDITMRSFVNNSLDSTYVISHKSTYTFVKDLTGTRVDSAGNRFNLTWFVNDDNDNLQICYNNTSGQTCKLYLIETSSKTTQRIKYTEAGAVNGSYTEEEMTMTSVD